MYRLLVDLVWHLLSRVSLASEGSVARCPLRKWRSRPLYQHARLQALACAGISANVTCSPGPGPFQILSFFSSQVVQTLCNFSAVAKFPLVPRSPQCNDTLDNSLYARSKSLSRRLSHQAAAKVGYPLFAYAHFPNYCMQQKRGCRLPSSSRRQEDAVW